MSVRRNYSKPKFCFVCYRKKVSTLKTKYYDNLEADFLINQNGITFLVCPGVLEHVELLIKICNIHCFDQELKSRLAY